MLFPCALPHLPPPPPPSSSHAPLINPPLLSCHLLPSSTLHRAFPSNPQRHNNALASSNLFMKPFLNGDFEWPVLEPPPRSRSGLGNALIWIGARLKECPLKIMIAGPPASGKGTQSEMIAKKYGVIHISAGDLLRAEVAAGSENGNKAKECMNKGELVPDDIVITIVKERLSQADVQKNGWLLDGCPRSLSQAQALERACIRPQIFISLDVPDEIVIERIIGRRHDPVTGKIYHLKYSLPENDKIAKRLTQRFDDTEANVKLRLQTHDRNVKSVLPIYKDIIKKVDGNRPKDVVFKEIDEIISELLKEETWETDAAVALDETSNGSQTRSFSSLRSEERWKGIPTRLNNIPHTREIRQYFYKDVCQATKNAVEDGIHKLKVQIIIPELNPEMDVYRIGTLLELIRELALSFANDGKVVKVCVQGSMGEGIFSGMPLQLAGTRRMLEAMDWGEYEAKGNFIKLGSVGANDVHEADEMFILMAPQNAVGNCIIEDLQAMVDAAGKRPVILVNPRLKDLPSAGGVMQVSGREKRMEFTESFLTCYYFRLLYTAGTQYPILGSLRRAYPLQYELYKRIDLEPGKEKYSIIGSFNSEPSKADINDAFSGHLLRKETPATSIWGFLSSIF